MSEGKHISARYQRQVSLSEIGVEGQLKIQGTSVLVVGVGGLGCPITMALATAGIGRLGLVDFDRVDISNLHRQFLFTDKHVGQLKAEVAATELSAMAPDCVIEIYAEELTNGLALELFPKYDFIVDATDQVHIRYLINDACIILNKPWVYGAVNGFQGQWAVFNHYKNAGNYRDVFPVPPNPMTMINCENAGVLSPVPGSVGLMQAMLVVNNIVEKTAEKTILYTMDYWQNQAYNIEVVAGQNTQKIELETFKNMDYRKMVLGAHYAQK
ncbi:MAG: HesA/MoeB/ThiF family protein [Bacteroidia bacterium]|nr:HesA/MoeB/ThiF family protein [Bacteroidia bacterium]